jgi:hypothetical protein
MIGSRAQVWHGNADKTSGGLKKKDLKMKDGRIISKKVSKKSKAAIKKDHPFMAFIKKAKASNDGKFHRVPSKGTKEYKKMICA